ncbi:MAG: MoaD/ThiS family protein [Bacteroidetes bacterium]|nr:MoaD/ThiS family protein [Bacteroidota bacterium]
MNIHIRFFGSLADLIGKSKLVVNDCTDVLSVKEKIICEYPQLKDSVFLISVNKKLVKDNHLLEEGNEIAFLPPFAGG